MQNKINYIKNGQDSRINDYAHKHGSLYHLNGWFELIQKVFKHNTYYIYSENCAGDICGILPLVHIKSVLFGNYMVSMPYFNYGGAIADSSTIESEMIMYSANLAKSLGAEHIEFRGDKLNEMLPVRSDKVNMVLELPDSESILAKNIGSKLRSQIKRPSREGIKPFIGNSDLLDDFYHVFATNMRDLGTPVYAKRFFSEILITFPKQTKIIVLRYGGEPVSAAFLIGFRDQLEIPWASTIKKYNKYSPNMLLYWEVLKYAIDQGYKKFDFGRSSIDSGTYRFKKQWGAKPMQQYWHYWLADGKSMPALTPDNPKYKLAISIWQKFPLVLTKILGPNIIKNLP